MNIDYMDYEAVAGLRYNSLDDGHFMRAEIICNSNIQHRLNRANQAALNALTTISIESKDASDTVKDIIWRLA